MRVGVTCGYNIGIKGMDKFPYSGMNSVTTPPLDSGVITPSEFFCFRIVSGINYTKY